MSASPWVAQATVQVWGEGVKSPDQHQGRLPAEAPGPGAAVLLPRPLHTRGGILCFQPAEGKEGADQEGSPPRCAPRVGLCSDLVCVNLGFRARFCWEEVLVAEVRILRSRV